MENSIFQGRFCSKQKIAGSDDIAVIMRKTWSQKYGAVKNNLMAYVSVGMSNAVCYITRYKSLAPRYCRSYKYIVRGRHIAAAAAQIKTYTRHNLIVSDKKCAETAKVKLRKKRII